MVQTLSVAVITAALASVTQAWLPGHKIRGVNLGTQFIFEPWIDNDEWRKIGCDPGEQKSEFDCVLKLGQDTANKAFQEHYASWITEGDLDEMMGYGLNTIRVPLGYWLFDDLVDSSERFPRGAMDALTDLVGKASDRGMYIIIDLHGGPGAQEPNQPFTGQYNPNADFYNDYNYGRAVEWLKEMTRVIHERDEFRNAGMIELINEPETWDNAHDSLRSQYYVDAMNAIRGVERDMGVSNNNRLHIQMMSELWGSGNPQQYIPSTDFTAYDDHRYLKWDTSVSVNKENYIRTSCADERRKEDNLIVGEWSLSVPDNVEWSDDWNPFNNVDFYGRWFAAQVQTYERVNLGWVFWTWKAGLGDPRWSYRDAVQAGIIPRNINDALGRNVC